MCLPINILDVHVRIIFILFFSLPFPCIPHFSLPCPHPTPYLSLSNPSSCPTCCCCCCCCFCSIQRYNYTALIRAAEGGHSDVIKALVAAPGIDVNYKGVRNNRNNTFSYVVVLGESEGDVPPLPLPTLTPVIMNEPLTSKMYPITR